MKAWQQARVEAVQRCAREQVCPECGAPTLVGLDNDVMADTARVDLEPIPAGRRTLAVVVATLQGRKVYALGGHGSGLRLTWLDRSALGVTPWWLGRPGAAMGPSMPLVLAHRCGPS